MLEYVPIAIPKIIQRTKSFVVTPPQKYSANNVINVVNEVLILLVNVWFTEASTISQNDIFFE